MGPLPPIASRLGLDLHPVDVRDDAQVRWLKACVWADDPLRLARLADAITLARRDPPPLERCDLRTWTPPPGDDVVVWHCWVASYLTDDEQRALAARCESVNWIFAESPRQVPGLPVPAGRDEVTALVLRRPGEAPVRLADLHPHGRWMHWLGAHPH